MSEQRTAEVGALIEELKSAEPLRHKCSARERDFQLYHDKENCKRCAVVTALRIAEARWREERIAAMAASARAEKAEAELEQVRRVWMQRQDAQARCIAELERKVAQAFVLSTSYRESMTRSLQAEALMESALLRIAESYPWVPFEEGETIEPDELTPSGIPTNRSIARAALTTGDPLASDEPDEPSDDDVMRSGPSGEGYFDHGGRTL